MAGLIRCGLELPPHTRRRAREFSPRCEFPGTTSAYAEKRVEVDRCSSWSWNYLRIRGEEIRDLKTLATKSELPPHTRRRGQYLDIEIYHHGTTSAYAEKRMRKIGLFFLMRNYLRIRGEEVPSFSSIAASMELPPHTRRRVDVSPDGGSISRTTSAYAEKSRRLPRWG